MVVGLYQYPQEIRNADATAVSHACHPVTVVITLCSRTQMFLGLIVGF